MNTNDALKLYKDCRSYEKTGMIGEDLLTHAKEIDLFRFKQSETLLGVCKSVYCLIAMKFMEGIEIE